MAAWLIRCLLLLPLMASCTLPAWAQPRSEALHVLYAQEWERGLRDNPESASHVGDTRYNDRWIDLSLAAIARREAADRDALQRLQAIARAGLSPQDQPHHATFLWQLQRQVERQTFREHLQPIDHQGGVQTADNIAEVMPFATEADHRTFLRRMAGVPLLIEQTLALLRQGVQAGVVPPRVLMARVPAQMPHRWWMNRRAARSTCPLRSINAAVPAATQAALQAEARALITQRLVPAYRRLQDSFNTDHLPHTRTSVAASGRPDGAAHDDFLARCYTTTPLSADAIHATGLAEVQRLRATMEALKTEIGFAGDLQQFFTFLRSDPYFFHTTPQAPLDACRAAAKRIDPELVKVIRTQPRLP